MTGGRPEPEPTPSLRHRGDSGKTQDGVKRNRIERGLMRRAASMARAPDPYSPPGLPRKAS